MLVFFRDGTVRKCDLCEYFEKAQRFTILKMGKRVPLTAEDFKAFTSERIINAAEAAEILNCSRQCFNELVKKEQLHPIKASEKNTLFLKSEVLQRNWQ